MSKQYPLPDLMVGAKPRFMRGNEIGCLVVHGFMATPSEVGWLGEALAAEGYTVYVPRLTGHGIAPEDMPRMRWRDWYAQVLDGYYLLQQQCERVYVIGHSMGALLVTMLASQHHVDGLVVTAAPLTVRNRLMPYAHLLKWGIRFTNQPTEAPLQETILAEQRRRNEFESGRVNYAKWSSAAVAELHKLIHIGRAQVSSIKGNVLLIYAEEDEAVNLSDMALFQQEAPDATTQTYTLKRGGHIIYQDEAREEAFDVVIKFLGQLEEKYTQ